MQNGYFFKGDESKIFRVYGLNSRESFEIEEEIRLGVLTHYMGVLTKCYDKVVIFEKLILNFEQFI